MSLSLHSAATGMEAQQFNLNTIANNLANVNTTGFKRSQVAFQDLLYQKPRTAGTQDSGGNMVPTGIEVGNGTRVAATNKVFTQGELSSTGEKLDIAIQGDGFFEIQRPDGTSAYTRDGSFKVSATGQVTTNDGMPVLMARSPIPLRAARRLSESRSRASPIPPAFRVWAATFIANQPPAARRKLAARANKALAPRSRATSRVLTSISCRRW